MAGRFIDPNDRDLGFFDEHPDKPFIVADTGEHILNPRFAQEFNNPENGFDAADLPDQMVRDDSYEGDLAVAKELGFDIKPNPMLIKQWTQEVDGSQNPDLLPQQEPQEENYGFGYHPINRVGRLSDRLINRTIIR